MKKILSLILAVIMIASMAVLAFAEDSAADVTTVYDAPAFNTNVVKTPAAVSGKKGFAEFALKVDKDLAAAAETATDAVIELWSLENLKEGNTLKFYYYVAENTGAQVMLYGLDGASFYALNGSVGYHLAEIVITKDITKLAVYLKNSDASAAKSVELYVGSAVVREGKVFEPQAPAVYDAATLSATGATPGNLVDGAVEVVLSGDYNRFLNMDNLGYANGVYKLAIAYEYVGPTSALYFHNGACGFQAWDTIVEGEGVIEAEVAAGDNGYVYYNFHAPTKGGTLKIKSISIINADVANNMEVYYDAATLSATGATPGTLANGAVEVVLSGDYNRFLNADKLGYANGIYRVKLEYDYVGPTSALYFHNGACGFQAWDTIVEGSGVIEADVAAGDNGYVYYNFHAPTKGGTLKIKSIIIYDAALGDLEITPAAHPVLEEKYPLELVAEKYANKASTDVTAALSADKGYFVTLNYTNYGKDAAATVTVGGKTLTLKSGENQALTFAFVGGADKVVFNSPDALLLIGDITVSEATAAQKEVMNKIEAVPAAKSLDKTLATTPEAIEVYAKAAIEKNFAGCTVVSIECIEETLIPYNASAASVVAASAAENGSVNVQVTVEKDGVQLTTILAFSLIAGNISNYNAATGDSIIVAVVALVAVITLAGVVIAKKKVASK